MKIKKLLFVLLAVLLVFSLFGCGKKEPVEDTEPQDTTEQLDENISDDISDTISGDSQDGEVSEPQIVEMPQDMLHDLFKEQYEAARAAEWLDKDYGTDAYELYKKLPAGDIGTQEDANVYNHVKIKVYGYENGGGGIGRDSYSSFSDGFGSDDKYYGKYNLPTDGFAQYVSWRQQYEASLNQPTSNSSTANNSYVPDDAEYIPDGSSGMSTNIEDYVDPSLIEGDGTESTVTGVDPDDWYETMNGGALTNKDLPKPEYEIIG